MRALIHLLVLLTAALVAAPMAFARSPAPAADCMDARRMQEVRQATVRTLAISLDDGARFRIGLGADCPTALGQDGQIEVLAREGWVCRADTALVRGADDAVCPIVEVERIDARDYAELARASRDFGSGRARTLDTVEVRARHRRGFTGSTNFCLAARHVRSWSLDDEGFVIETAPRRTGGNRYYRVETMAGCSLPPNARSAIVLRSGVGTGVICGYPGDRVELLSEWLPFDDFMFGETNFANRLWPVLGTQCPVTAVYPLERPGWPRAVAAASDRP